MAPIFQILILVRRAKDSKIQFHNFKYSFKSHGYIYIRFPMITRFETVTFLNKDYIG
jgi:hypothetical protein